MKVYYLIGAGIGLVLALIMFAIMGIGGCVMRNNARREINGYSDWVCVRYYMGDTDDSVVKYKMVDDNTFVDFSSSELPKKEGYVFAGFYDNKDFNMGAQYVDERGEGLIAITDDIILYPVFTSAEG